MQSSAQGGTGTDESEVPALSKAASVNGTILTVMCVIAAVVVFIFGAIVGAVVAIVGIESERKLEEK